MEGVNDTSKSDVFANELAWIQDPDKREFTRRSLEALPDYFYEVAASSTGKYHPDYALGTGGLVRHTKAAVTIAKDLLGLEMYGRYTPAEKDNILITLLLHDGMKHGRDGGKWTVFRHPIEIVGFLAEENLAAQYMSEADFDQICSGLVSHMGQWNYDNRSGMTLPKPESAFQKFVHQCDYLASRRYLEVNFDKINYTGDRV